MKFAPIARQGGQAALPADSSKVSTRHYTQPQRLAILCLRRDADWPFRAAAGRWAEHAELRAALPWRRVPDDTTVYRGLRRLDEAALAQALSAVVQRLPRKAGPQATVAIDATGLAPGAISPCFVKRANDRGEGFTGRHGLQWTMGVDSDHRVILAQTARCGPTNDCAS